MERPQHSLSIGRWGDGAGACARGWEGARSPEFNASPATDSLRDLGLLAQALHASVSSLLKKRDNNSTTTPWVVTTKGV